MRTNVLRHLLGLLAVVLLGGCSLHTPIEPSPSEPLPERFSRELSTEDLRLNQAWWTVFSDPQLEAVMDRALVKNLDLEQAWARWQQAEAVRRVAGSALWPTLNAEADASRQRSISEITGDSQNYGVASAWEVDLWGKLRASNDAARGRWKASEEDIRDVYLSLSAQVADAYFLWQEQQAQLDLAEQTIASTADTLSRVERRYRGGLAGALDVYQSRQNLASAQAARAVRTQAIAEATSGLFVLLGEFTPDERPFEAEPLPLLDVPWAKGLSAELLLQRPDVRAAALRLWALDRDLEAAIADRLPTLTLGGSIGRSRSDLSGFSLSGLVWNLFADLTLPLVDGGRRRAEVDRSRAEVDEALAFYRQTLLLAAKEVEDALVAEQQTRIRVERLKQEAEAADASLRLATDNYFQGLSDYLEVLSNQRFQFDARSRLLTARRELVGTQVGLARALAGSWMKSTMDQRKQQLLDRGGE